MSAKGSIAVAFAVLALVMAWLALGRMRVAGEWRRAMEGLAKEDAILERQLADAMARGVTASGHAAQLEKAMEGLRPAGGLPEKKALAPEVAFQIEPRRQNLSLAHLRSMTHLQLGRFYRASALRPEQIDEFESLFGEHLGRQTDIYTAGLENGLTDSDPEIAALLKQENDQYHAAQREILGDAGYAQLQAFNANQSEQSTADSLARTLALSPEPLSERQHEQLVQLLQASRSPSQSGGPGALGPINWDAVLAQPPPFLSPAQVAELAALARNISVNSMDAGSNSPGAKLREMWLEWRRDKDKAAK